MSSVYNHSSFVLMGATQRKLARTHAEIPGHAKPANEAGPRPTEAQQFAANYKASRLQQVRRPPSERALILMLYPYSKQHRRRRTNRTGQQEPRNCQLPRRRTLQASLLCP